MDPGGRKAGSKGGLKKASPRATINDMEKQNVTREYLDAAAPGQGSVSYQKGYKPGEHKKEIQMAEWLYNTFGGDVSLLTESKEPGDKTPDFLWNGKSWELKGVSGKSSVDRAVRDAAKRIQVNTGGIILDCSASVLPTEDIESIVSQRARRVALDSVDVLFVSDSKIKKVLRYTKK